MADILIKNIEMPKDFTDGLILTITGGIAYDVTHGKELEAIELPPHGRLVELKGVVQVLYETHCANCRHPDECSPNWCHVGMLIEKFKNAPTVVEASI